LEAASASESVNSALPRVSRGISLAPIAETLPTARLRKFLILREAIIYTHYRRVLDRATLRPGFTEAMDQMRTNLERSATDAEFEET
jgi:hypothetical protein